MAKKEYFDISKFLTVPMSLRLSSNAQTRHMYDRDDINPSDKICKLNVFEILGDTSFSNTKRIPQSVVGTSIQEFYRGAHVFITGGTGFIGKILTEKLVRSVPHLEQIYLLIRAKRGKSAQARFEQLLDNPVFRRMKAEVGDFASKLTMLEGDILAPGLGLSAADERTVLDHVTMVFHCAADVRFIEPLRTAVSSNVIGSRNVLALARRITKLKSYVHVSTAFSQCVRRVVAETVPKMSVDYKQVLTLIDSLSDEEIEKSLDRIMLGWPNTYTFTKAMCEEMMIEEGQGLPICIFRPTVVVNTYMEPVRGWTDNMYGPIGMAVAASMGVLHCFRQEEDLCLDMVPVDYTVNCIIAAAWHSTTNKENSEMRVYNFVSMPNAVSWKAIQRYGQWMKDKFPILQSIWCLSFIMTTSFWLDETMHFLFHKIPGLVLDRVAVSYGGKPRLTKVYDTIYKIKGHLRFFAVKQWEFESDNVQNMLSVMTPEDKTLFNFDVRDIQRFEHVLISKLGVRYYYLKEKMDTLTQAHRKNIVFTWVHSIGKCAFGLVLLKLSAMVAHALPF